MATPWPVNLLILIPFAAYFYFVRSRKLQIGKSKLIILAIFAAAFGFIESAVVTYLRVAVGLLSPSTYQPVQILNGLEGHLFLIEFFREAATLVILICIAFLAVPHKRERVAAFLWSFAVWDIFYYFWLYVLIGWPWSLANTDVLFLIPVAWLAPVWFPLLVSILTIAAVLISL